MLRRYLPQITLAALVMLALVAVALRLQWFGNGNSQSKADTAAPRSHSAVPDPLLGQRLAALQEQQRRLETTVWANDLLAERYAAVIESFWDRLNVASDKLAVAADLSFVELLPCNPGPPRNIEHGISVFGPGSVTGHWAHADWISFIAQMASDGWQLKKTEFRHNRFDVNSAGRPSSSTFYFSGHLENPTRQRRATIEGDLIVHWDSTGIPAGEVTSGEPLIEAGAPIPETTAPDPQIRRIDASRLTIKTRDGVPPFRRILNQQVLPPNRSYFVDPLIVHDLDRDGIPEIILAAGNQIFRRQRDGGYAFEPLTRHGVGLIFTALIADFTGNGTSDLLVAGFDGLSLFEGTEHGAFDQPPRHVWKAQPRLKYGQAFSCGDIDADGDLDVWLGQYKVPYDRGQMPTPYYDANDGHPDFLLKNDGDGTFTDITAGSGLEPKRHRRTYTGSLAHLDDDGDLDLVVVSDFAGVDFYSNDGRGNFTDVTAQWADEIHAFGMAHALTDFNSDGALDFLMIGMNSPTADRLDRGELVHPDFPGYDAMRPKMVFGNRLYYRHSTLPFFRQAMAGDAIARAGWAWGCGAADLDNNRFPDLYIANGHESKQSVRDYEPEFWRHDIYLGRSTDDPVLTAYFGSKFAATRGQGFSYGGFEINRLYWNRNGNEFVEAGFLMGVALQQDSRNVISEDLNADGKPDLIVTTFEAWPEVKQTIQVFQNELPQVGEWIGIRFDSAIPDSELIGAQLAIRSGEHTAARQIVTGDSYRSQHSTAVHVGLGNSSAVDRIDIRLTGGRTAALRNPEANRFHQIRMTNFD